VPNSALDRYCGAASLPDASPVPGSSNMADAFGANVGVATEGVLLCLVVGRVASPEHAVASVGGDVLVRIPDGRRVLATASYSGLVALQRHPDVALAGPVSIDRDRFGRFAQLVGLDAPDQDEDIDNPDAAARR
jgi:hypothetical protein